MLSYIDFIYTFLPLSHQVDTSHKITYLLRLQRPSNKKLWKQYNRKNNRDFKFLVMPIWYIRPIHEWTKKKHFYKRVLILEVKVACFMIWKEKKNKSWNKMQVIMEHWHLKL